jgi:Do/DeqQ family serine protease
MPDLRSTLRRRVPGWAAGLAALALFGGGFAAHGVADGLMPGTAAVSAAPAGAATNVATTSAAESGRVGPTAAPVASYADIVARVAPAVVTIRTSQRVHETAQPMFDDPFFDQFFPAPRRPRTYQEQALGSGVIVRADGYILTNEHVIDGADSITVDLSDRRSLPAHVVGSDKPSDLAVLKIDATGLDTLPIANSDQVRVGDVVLAVGDPLGVGRTVTMGIISAKGRVTSLGDGSYEDFLQTDAPINRGNSGGALVDMKGELVGINAQILSPSGGNIGLGFAIPSGMAKSVAEQLINGGVVHRAKLGVTVQGVTPEIAESLGLKDNHGALVSSVEAGSPADRAGVKVQDVIVGFDGPTVTDSNSLRNLVASTRPGSAAELKILRDGRPETLTAHVVERDGEKGGATRGNRGRGGEGQGESGYGMTLSPMTPQLARQYDVPASTSGVVVTDVDPDSVAASAGVRPGDVIKRVNGREVASVASLRTALNGQAGKPALMLVTRQGADIFVALPSARS